jgi:hypothetical protein
MERASQGGKRRFFICAFLLLENVIHCRSYGDRRGADIVSVAGSLCHWLGRCGIVTNRLHLFGRGASMDCARVSSLYSLYQCIFAGHSCRS